MSLPRPHVRLACLALAALMVGGCAGTRGGGASGGGGGFLRSARRGSLKENLSRLQHENDELEQKLASVNDEVKHLSSELEDAEVKNTDLANRLDSMRSMAKGGGSNSDLSYLPDPDTSPERTTRPTGRTPYKAPFTQIPNRIEVTRPPDSESSTSVYTEPTQPLINPPPSEYFDLNSGSSRKKASASTAGRPDPDGSAASSSSSSRSTWSPVARGGADPTSGLR